MCQQTGLHLSLIAPREASGVVQAVEARLREADCRLGVE